jgi:hypothetical protein
MTLLGPSLTHIFEVKIPISTFLHGCESEKIVVNLGYGYLPRVNEVRSFANKEDKYCLVSKSALYISSMLVELYNQSYENALFGFRICK